MQNNMKPVNSKSSGWQRPSQSGFSLVELMISLVVFALLATGVTSSILLTYRLSLNTMESNTALTMGYGYTEQLKSLSFGEISSALQNASTPIMLYRLHNSSSAQHTEEPFYFNIYKEVEVPVEFSGMDSSSTLDVRLRIRGQPIPQREAIELFIDVEWMPTTQRLRGGSEWQTRTLRIIKTAFTEY